MDFEKSLQSGKNAKYVWQWQFVGMPNIESAEWFEMGTIIFSFLLRNNPLLTAA